MPMFEVTVKFKYPAEVDEYECESDKLMDSIVEFFTENPDMLTEAVEMAEELSFTIKPVED